MFIIHPCDPTVVICYLIWPCDISVHTTNLISQSSSLSYNTVIKGYFSLGVYLFISYFIFKPPIGEHKHKTKNMTYNSK